MATQTVEFSAAPSQTITAKLFAVGSDTVVQSVTATESTNRKGLYSAAYTNAPAALYKIIAFVGATPVATWWVDLTLTTATFQAYEVPESIFAGGGGGGGTDWTTAERTALRSILGFDASGNVIDPTVGILDTIRDKTSLITANTIFVSNPVAALGNIRAPIFINTDYLAAQGNAFTWTIPAISGWTAATVTPLFGLRLGTAKVQVTGTATDNGDGTWDLVFDVVALDTVAMVPGYYTWTVDVSYQQYIITKVYSDKPVELRYNETDAPLPP